MLLLTRPPKRDGYLWADTHKSLVAQREWTGINCSLFFPFKSIQSNVDLNEAIQNYIKNDFFSFVNVQNEQRSRPVQLSVKGHHFKVYIVYKKRLMEEKTNNILISVNHLSWNFFSSYCWRPGKHLEKCYVHTALTFSGNIFTLIASG